MTAFQAVDQGSIPCARISMLENTDIQPSEEEFDLRDLGEPDRDALRELILKIKSEEETKNPS